MGRDLAAITDVVLALDGTPVERRTGTVTAGGSPVAGARVHVLLDGAPFTVAVTGADGSFAVDVPAGADVRLRASGQHDGLTLDLPDGWGPSAPYAAAGPAARARASLSEGAPPIPAAEGFGLAPPDDPLALPEPARLTVRSHDGLPFEVRIFGPALEGDPRLVRPAPDGTRALAWARDGEVSVSVPAGPLTLEAHRGLRYERWTGSITVAPGEAADVDIRLREAFETSGWLVVDPHSHASPSGDGRATMEARLLGSAARGVQIHVGTDHDHVADYRPLVAALGLEDHLRSVVGNEVSPTLRGHLNAWPLRPRTDLPNHGAIRWWTAPPASTDALVARFAQMGDRVFVQADHPLDNGIADAARWQPGRVRSADRWSDRLDLIEVNNAGGIDENIPLFLDLVSRGHRIAPVGVSDAHGPTSGGLGLNVTFLGTGGDLADADEEAVADALEAGRTIASRGIFLDLSTDPGATVEGGTDLTVTARSASWARVDRIRLYRDGQPVDEVPGTTATFSLRPQVDAVYVIEAEGDTAMGGPWGGTRPWAMASPVRVDVEGDGWESPLPPLDR